MDARLLVSCTSFWSFARCDYYFTDIAITPTTIQVATALMNARATFLDPEELAGQEPCLDVDTSAAPGASDVDALECLLWLADCGHVSNVETVGSVSRWRLTRRGTAAIGAIDVYDNPSLLFQAGPASLERLDLQEATPWELVQLLESRGWSWSELPTRRRERPALAYRPADREPVRKWCSRKDGAVSRVYLACLAQADAVLRASGLDCLEHGLPDSSYSKLLKGLGDSSAVASTGPAPAREAPLAPLQADIDIDEAEFLGSDAEGAVGALPDAVAVPASPGLESLAVASAPDTPVAAPMGGH
eukprot:8301165-Alexandrium_andersonii.AAC.1